MDEAWQQLQSKQATKLHGDSSNVTVKVFLSFMGKLMGNCSHVSKRTRSKPIACRWTVSVNVAGWSHHRWNL